MLRLPFWPASAIPIILNFQKKRKKPKKTKPNKTKQKTPFGQLFQYWILVQALVSEFICIPENDSAKKTGALVQVPCKTIFFSPETMDPIHLWLLRWLLHIQFCPVHDSAASPSVTLLTGGLHRPLSPKNPVKIQMLISMEVKGHCRGGRAAPWGPRPASLALGTLLLL